MHKPAFQKRKVELLFVWIIPSIVLVASFCYWYLQGKLELFGYLFVAPVVLAAVFVNIATDHLNLWRWNTTFFSNWRWLYRPVVYSLYFNLMYLLGAYLLMAPTTLWTLVESFVAMGLIGMMIGVLFDLFTLDVGFIAVTRPRFNLARYGTILALTRYAFLFFGSLGAAGGVAGKLGHYYLYEQPASIGWLPLAVVAGVAMSPPFIVWAYLFDSRKYPRPSTPLAPPYSLEPVETEKPARQVAGGERKAAPHSC